MGVAGGSGQTAVAEQLLQFPDVTAPFVEQQIGRTVAQPMSAYNRNADDPARGRQAAIEGLVANGSSVPAWENQIAPRKFNGAASQTDSFEAFQKLRPLAK